MIISKDNIDLPLDVDILNKLFRHSGSIWFIYTGICQLRIYGPEWICSIIVCGSNPYTKEETTVETVGDIYKLINKYATYKEPIMPV